MTWSYYLEIAREGGNLELRCVARDYSVHDHIVEQSASFKAVISREGEEDEEGYCGGSMNTVANGHETWDLLIRVWHDNVTMLMSIDPVHTCPEVPLARYKMWCQDFI